MDIGNGGPVGEPGDEREPEKLGAAPIGKQEFPNPSWSTGQPPAWWATLTSRVRLAAVATEMALTSGEFDTCWSNMLDDRPSVPTDFIPLCAWIAHDVATDSVDWLDPALHGESEFGRAWAEFAAAHLGGLPDAEAWRLVAIITAANLAGRTPDAKDVLELASRACAAGRGIPDNDKAEALLTAYDRFTANPMETLPDEPSPALAQLLASGSPSTKDHTRGPDIDGASPAVAPVSPSADDAGLTSPYPTYADGSPIPNDMRSLTSGRRWWRTSQDRWTDGVMTGGWTEVEKQDGPMLPLTDTPQIKATARPAPSQQDVTEALGLLAECVNSNASACLYDLNGNCQEHDWVSDPEAPDEQCTTTRARNLLARLGCELQEPKPVHERQPPSTPDSDYTSPFRTAAVCLELALRPTERGTIVSRLGVNPGIRRLFPVCALLGLGLNHDDALSWTEPLYEPDCDPAWNEFAATLPDDLRPGTWRAVSVLGAAYLHGRQPTSDEVLQLARRALERGRPLLHTDEARRLFAAFDDHADYEVPGGLRTDSR